ncbi:MAG TPA: molybdopterin-binding protein [Syntrophomonadaceae bacterium]|nr:molybdopterin-binding protein [Syntrophomonadaceae bacterium]HRX21173.1 molybdopterin-binding protein [Syntrophomonadaceae bacterium]
MKLQTVEVQNSVGKMICHDITKVTRGEFKDAIFRKGHIVQPDDIPVLLKIGKENLYIMELDSGDIHEDIAGIRLGTAVAGNGIYWRGPKESKVSLYAEYDGLLKINVDALEAINDLPDVILSTLHNNSVVKKDDLLAGTKVIPLVVPEETVAVAENICREAGWVTEVVPFKSLKAGLVITGNEVYKQRIRDGFGPVIKEKMQVFGQDVLRIDYAPDDCEDISSKIKKMVDDGAGLVMVTGGMSVDPDDVTPKAISLTGAEVIRYGAPVMPGAMFMLAYLNNVPVMGVPACGMFFKTTIVDILLPRILVGERLTKRDITLLGHGGLCRGCETCRFPNCTFGIGH